jgi:hypothetical protein
MAIDIRNSKRKEQQQKKRQQTQEMHEGLKN